MRKRLTGIRLLLVSSMFMLLIVWLSYKIISLAFNHKQDDASTTSSAPLEESIGQSDLDLAAMMAKANKPNNNNFKDNEADKVNETTSRSTDITKLAVVDEEVETEKKSSGRDSAYLYFFESYIKVNPNSSITVTESYYFYSDGKPKTMSLARIVPVIHKQAKDQKIVKLDLEINKVTRDGEDMDYFIQDTYGAKAIRIKQKVVELSEGFHKDSISYTLSNRIWHFDNSDELYWDVVGGDKAFIDRAKVTIELPDGAKPLLYNAATGYENEKGKDFDTNFDKDGNLTFIVDRTLGPGEYITICVNWPTGFTQNNDSKIDSLTKRAYKSAAFLEGAFMALSWILILALLNNNVRKITPSIKKYPTRNLTPSIMAFVNQVFQLNEHVVATALVNLASRDYLKIRKINNKFILERLYNSSTNFPKADLSLLNAIFKRSNLVEINSFNTHIFKQALRSFKLHFSLEFEKFYISHNTLWRVWLFMHTILMTAIFFMPYSDNSMSLQYPMFVYCFAIVFYVALREPFFKTQYFADKIEGFSIYLKQGNTKKEAAENNKIELSVDNIIQNKYSKTNNNAAAEHKNLPKQFNISAKEYVANIPYALACNSLPEWQALFAEQSTEDLSILFNYKLEDFLELKKQIRMHFFNSQDYNNNTWEI